MSIINYQTMLKEVKNKILNDEFKHKNSIIIGDNASGKSELIKQLLTMTEEGYYFIDSVNRSFDYTKVSSSKNIEGSYKNVLDLRLSTNKFNLKDSFGIYETGLGSIEQIYFNYEKKLKILFESFLNKELDIKIEQSKIIGDIYNLYIDGSIEQMSSGYQAIIRLFIEILYFEDMINISESSSFVVIDEINEFLSSKNEYKILPFIMKEFSNLYFIVTTHSADVIASSIDCNIIVIKNETYECLDGNDFITITDVREIFENIYNISIDIDDKKQDIDIILRNLLNSKISNKWTEVENEKMNEIEMGNLTNIQKVLLKQIKSW